MLVSCKESGIFRMSVWLPEIFYSFCPILCVLNGASGKECQTQEICSATMHCAENVILADHKEIL